MRNICLDIIPLNFAKKRLGRTRTLFPNFFDFVCVVGKFNQAKRKGERVSYFRSMFFFLS